MYISAQRIVEKMEEELIQIAERSERNETSAVQAHARVLKAYCDLLLEEDSREEVKSAHMRKEGLAPKVKSPSQTSSPAVSHQNNIDIPSTDGNLLEF